MPYWLILWLSNLKLILHHDNEKNSLYFKNGVICFYLYGTSQLTPSKSLTFISNTHSVQHGYPKKVVEILFPNPARYDTKHAEEK